LNAFSNTERKNAMNQVSDQNPDEQGGLAPVEGQPGRRCVLKAGIAAGTALVLGAGQSEAQRGPVAAEKSPRPPSSLVLDRKDTALVVIDPQNDVLSEKGVSWGLLRDSLKENNAVENIARLFKAAKKQGYGVFISPHYLYPTDQAWQFGGAVEKMMLEGKEFFRPGPLSLARFPGSGADWLDRYKPFIEDGKTVVVSPHKVYSPQCNDLVLQLRKRRINKVVLAGMMANLCVESHLRELLEQGFEVAVVKDATAGPRHPDIGDGYKAAVINYGFLANAILTTDDAVRAMR
jgi:nicotinamidase-related amidase